jgi:hypothetical protein
VTEEVDEIDLSEVVDQEVLEEEIEVVTEVDEIDEVLEEEQELQEEKINHLSQELLEINNISKILK